jgi:hypothetical protein
MYPVNINHGNVDGVKTDYMAYRMGVVFDGIYIYTYILFIYLFGVQLRTV